MNPNPLRHVLVATDFSPASERAVDAAAELATRFGAKLTILHVLLPDPYPYPVPMGDELRTAAQQQLDRVSETLRARALTPVGVLRQGIPWTEIVSLAKEIDADLVVVGSHGRRGLPHALLGSVAEKVVRLSPAPVLTMHSWRFESREQAGRELAKALSPIRAEIPVVLALSPGAVVVGLEVARELGSTLDLLSTRTLAYLGSVFGAVCETGTAYFDPEAASALRLSPADCERMASTAGADLRDEALRLRGSRWIGDLWQRTVVLVSDGLTAPWPVLAASTVLGTLGVRRILAATPVGWPAALEAVQREMGDLVFVESIPEHADLATAYRDFTSPSERAVVEALRTPLPIVAA